MKASLLLAGILTLAFTLTGCETQHETAGLDTVLQRDPDTFFEQAVVGPQDDGTYVVATTQRIDPAGTTIEFPGRPTDLALNPDETLLAVKNKSDLVLFDTGSKSIVQTLPLPEGGHSFAGLIWTADGGKIWTTDTEGFVRSAARQDDGTFVWEDAWPMPAPDGDDGRGPYPGGLALDEANGLVYVALSRNNALGVVNIETGAIEALIPVGIAPYTVLLQNDKAYVSNWGGRQPKNGDVTGPSSGSKVVVDPETGVASSGTVSVIDLSTRLVSTEIDVRLHPSGMVFSPDGTRLYVANANSDLVSVIDTATDAVAGEMSSKPMPDLPFGSMPNALALSPDGGTLYVANGGNNLLASIDLAENKVTGLIPTGWYPGAVILSADGSTIYVANTKGVGGRDETRVPSRDHGLNSHDHTGSVSFIDTPDLATLETLTIRAAANMRLPKITQTMNLAQVEERVVPIPTHPGETSVFKHVIYIIKENRTYDQVFGDLPQGNGDPTLTHFGWDVTPNHHTLAERYVLLDNTYCNGVLSADGHQWTNEGVVTDYLEKSFGGFVRSYPYDGDDALAYASSGFIWDYVLRAGLTFRDYGEFVKARIEPSDATWTDIYNDYVNNTNHVSIRAETELHTLEPYLAPTYVGFPGSVPDVYRAREFIKELNEFEKSGDFPNLTIMLLPNDHTVGTREGFPTPAATVADNDLALGQIVEAVSKSRFWKETVIFVVQDDPQAGLDHVDGRRTVALAVSPYTKRGEVISTHYNQNSILRTIELILGLPPMTQFDMAATSMEACFTEEPDFSPYDVVPNRIPLDQMNPGLAQLEGKQLFYAQKSMEMPLDDIDQADETIFNRILWHSVKGYDTPYPEIVRTANGER